MTHDFAKNTSISKTRRLASAVQVTWKKQSANMPTARITGYQIRYSTSSSIKNAKTVKVKAIKQLLKRSKGLRKIKNIISRYEHILPKIIRQFIPHGEKENIKKVNQSACPPANP